MDYSKLPKHEHEKVIQYFNDRNYIMLLEIHNKYKLTTYNYKCCGINGLIAHYKHGIDSGQITAN